MVKTVAIVHHDSERNFRRDAGVAKARMTPLPFSDTSSGASDHSQRDSAFESSPRLLPKAHAIKVISINDHQKHQHQIRRRLPSMPSFNLMKSRPIRYGGSNQNSPEAIFQEDTSRSNLASHEDCLEQQPQIQLRLDLNSDTILIQCSQPCSCHSTTPTTSQSTETTSLRGHVTISSDLLALISEPIISVTFRGLEEINVTSRSDALPHSSEVFKHTTNLKLRASSRDVPELTYPFEIRVPTWLPPSAVSTSWAISYSMTAEIRSPKRTRGFVDSRKVHLKRLHEYQVLTSSRFDGQTEDGSFAVSLNVQKEVTLSTAQTPLYVELGIERNHPVSGSIRVVRVGLYEARRYCFQAKTTTGSLRRETEIEMVPVTDTTKVKLSPEGHASLRIPLPSPLEILPFFKSKNIHVYHVLGVTVSYNALYPSSSPTSLASSSDDSEAEKSDTSSFWKGIRSFVGPKWVVKDSGFACSVRLLLDTTNPQFE